VITAAAPSPYSHHSTVASVRAYESISETSLHTQPFAHVLLSWFDSDELLYPKNAPVTIMATPRPAEPIPA
jgi:hypothetical protein